MHRTSSGTASVDQFPTQAADVGETDDAIRVHDEQTGALGQRRGPAGDAVAGENGALRVSQNRKRERVPGHVIPNGVRRGWRYRNDARRGVAETRLVLRQTAEVPAPERASQKDQYDARPPPELAECHGEACAVWKGEIRSWVPNGRRERLLRHRAALCWPGVAIKPRGATLSF